MFPTQIRIGPVSLPAYATLLSLGLVGGVLINLWRGTRRGITQAQCFDASLLAAVGGLVGARVAYAAVNWAYFRDNLSEALRLWTGGLAWQGGLVLGLLLVVLYGARYRLSLGMLFDALTLGLAWFTLCVWLGSGVASDIFGRETFPSDGLLWRLSADLPDLYGLRAPRVNVPLLGIFWSSLVFAALWFLQDRLNRRGSLFLLYLTLSGLGGLVLVRLQANAVPYIFGVRVDWLFYLVLVSVGLTGLAALKLLAIHADRGITRQDTRFTNLE
jgi:phosphatidylglycerol:prolipoprotein diacylglycerol transferase